MNDEQHGIIFHWRIILVAILAIFSEFVRAATGKVNWFGFPITCYSNIKTILQ